jgi:soluble lytic murein transglycosylase-like protein
MTTDEIKALVIQKANQYGINPGIALAQIQRESGFNPRAVSPAGAKGVAQFMPDTAARFGLADPFDPVASMDAWGNYMVSLMAMFNGRYDLALAGYNSGENRAEYAAAAREGRPINWSVLPPGVQSQTKPYVEAIMSQAGFTADSVARLDQVEVSPTPDWLKWAGLGLIGLLVWTAFSD